MSHNQTDRCPLCDHAAGEVLLHDKQRSYLRCTHCTLLYVPAIHHLSFNEERARYDLHQNDPADADYRAFLAPLADAVIAATEPHAQGLDFGCGPGPALAQMLESAGRSVALYDPFFARDESVWSRRYDFIVSSEVFEHLYTPRVELERLFAALQPGGLLGVMTSFVPADDALPNWHYLRDPTHVCFYGRSVFEFIARTMDATVEFPARNVALLRRRD